MFSVIIYTILSEHAITKFVINTAARINTSNINTFYNCIKLISLRALYMVLTGIFSLSAALSLLFTVNKKERGRGRYTNGNGVAISI